jgi:hypothetical protein
MEDDWSTPKVSKRTKLSQRRQAQKEVVSVWEKHVAECPHIITPDKIPVGIDGLVDKFNSEEWINLQNNGWKFIRIIKPNDPTTLFIPDQYDSRIYKELPINNKWNDRCLFEFLI